MSYENRESWWKNLSDFEKEITDQTSNTLKYDKIYDAGINVINNCEQKIKSDEAIPARETTEWETNKLASLKKRFLARKQDLEAEEQTLSQDSKKKLITILAKQIDEAENETLNRLKLIGTWAESRLLAQEDIWDWRNLPMEVYDSGLIKLQSWAEKFKMKNLKFLFSDYSYTEHYANWAWARTNVTTSRNVENRSKRYFVDFTNCSDSNLNEIKKHLGIIDEVTVTTKRPKNAPYTVTTDDLIDKIRWRISYDNDTNSLKWEWEENSVYKRDTGVTADLILNIPLFEWTTIQEEWAMKASASINLNEVRKDKDELYFWKLSLDNYSGNPEENPELKKYTSFFNNFDNNKLRLALKDLWNEKYNNFIIATENEVRKQVQAYRILWYTLQTPPVTNGWDWLMTLHFWDKELRSCEVPIWTNKDNCPLNKDLYDMIEDDYEDEFNEYLTNSINSKFEESSYLATNKQILTKKFEDVNDEDILRASEKEWILRWLGLLNELTIDMVNISNNDENCEKCLRFLGDLIYSVSNTQRISRSEIHWIVNGKMVSYYREIHKWIPIIDDHRIAWEHYLWDLIFGDKNTQESAFRGISEMFNNEIWQWQRDRLATATDENWERKLSVENQELNECLKNIDNYFWIKDFDINFKHDWENMSLITNKKLETIDKLYLFADYPANEGYNQIRDYLTSLNIIPEKYKYKNEIQEACKWIYKKLRNQSAMIEKKMPNKIDIKNQWNDRKVHLELLKADWKLKKGMDKELEILTYYVDNPHIMDFAIEKTLSWLKAQIKFEWINDLIYGSLFPVYWDLSWWTTGEWSRIYNDSMWYWWFNLTDENSRLLEMIAEDVAITALTLPIWWAAATWIAAFRAVCTAWRFWMYWMKIVKMEKRLQALARLISIKTKSKFWEIWARIWATVWREAGWRRSWRLLVEWWESLGKNVAKNTFTNMYNNIWHWDWPFDGLNIDSTIASSLKDLTAFWFAWWAIQLKRKFLKFDTSFLNSLPSYITNWSKKLWEDLFKEVAWQPVVNLVLWHTTIDSETWEEITSNEFVRDDKLIWNLMATVLSKANNSSTWKKISSKLADWSYKIFFDKNKNEFFAQNHNGNKKLISLNHLEDLDVV